jgi:RimJ/RimL family protein N-acetyltransferase
MNYQMARDPNMLIAEPSSSDLRTTPATIRRLWAVDAHTFRDHLLRLDPNSRHQRFGGGMSDDFLAHYAENCFGQADLVFGAYLDGHLVGAAELRSCEAIWAEQAPFQRHLHAEAAFSIESAYRRRGMGEQLFRRIQIAASNHGVETIDIVCLPDNVGMIRLANKFKTHFSFEENAFAGRLTARRPTPFSLLNEMQHDAVDFARSMLDMQMRAFSGRT